MNEEMKASEIVESQRDWRTRKMETYTINGIPVKTNYGSGYGYPYWDGNGNEYIRVVEPYESDGDVFNKLVGLGYNYIRFVETTTRIRGYHKIYVRAERRKNIA